MSEFRFQDFEIWKRAGDIAWRLFRVADNLDTKHLYRFAEQLRAATLSMPNNIAEGSGSYSNQEFRHFLNIARRSVFECASMLLLFAADGFVDAPAKQEILTELEQLSKMISGFRNSLQ